MGLGPALLLVPAILVAAGLGLVFAGLATAEGRSPVPIGERVQGLLRPTLERADRRRRARGRPALADQLAQADLHLRPWEFSLLQAGCALGLGLAGLLRFGLGFEVPVLTLLGYVAPLILLRARRRRRTQAFNQRLAATLRLLANALRAGNSFIQAADAVAQRGGPPVAEEFGRAVHEMMLGASLDDSLRHMARRVKSSDLDLVVTAVAIQHASGGNLAEMLETIAATIDERVRLKSEIRTLTAQARASSLLISLLPFAVAAFMFIATPGYFRPMLQSPVGWLMLAVVGVLILTGNLLLRRISHVEVGL